MLLGVVATLRRLVCRPNDFILEGICKTVEKGVSKFDIIPCVRLTWPQYSCTFGSAVLP